MRRLRVLLAALAAMAAGSAAAAGHVSPRSADEAVSGSLDSLISEFGAPILLVEAERPEHPDDRRVATSLAKALAARGMRCADGPASRERRRDLVDESHRSGTASSLARALLDRPDADFIVRVTASLRDAGTANSYGIQITARECSVTVAMLRAADHSPLPLAAASSVARSHSPDVASKEAEAGAVEEAAGMAVAAAFEEWTSIAEGRRPFIVEVALPSPGDAERFVSLAGAGVSIRENRPGVRTILEVPAARHDRHPSQALPGTVILRRPGFAVVRLSGASDDAWFPWAVGLVILAVLAWVVGGRVRTVRRARAGAAR